MTSSTTVLGLVLLGVALSAGSVADDCARLLDSTRAASGSTAGITSCTMSAPRPIESADGAAYELLEVGVSGTLDGFTVKEGPRYEMLTDLPEFALAQRQNLGPYFRATGTYSAEKGNLLTIFLPQSAEHWNGKMFVLVHGMSSYGKVRDLQPRTAGRYAPLMNVNMFAGLMIDAGYAVVHTSRPAARRENGASESVVLRDGTEMGEKSFGYHAGLIKDWTELATRIVRERLGRDPDRTYFYGKSAGASLGRLLNYVPDVNVRRDGARMFDGFIIDDAGGGWYMPTLNFRRVHVTEDGFSVEAEPRDRLVFDQARRDAFAPQIDLVHQAYTGADFVEGNYLSLKRENAVLLQRKGLGDKTRTYEVVGLSHADAGNVWPSPLFEENLDLSGIMDALIAMLDGWVEGAITPPPTRSDDARVGDVDGDRVLDHPAIQLPEIACPLGVYYEFPPGVKVPGRTGFAPFLDSPRPALNADTTAIPESFDPEWLEPLDSRGRPLDMNRNGVRDTRETVEQAWRRRRIDGARFGVLDDDQVFTWNRYASCVVQAASALAEAGLLSEEALLHYIEEALAARQRTDPPRMGAAPAGRDGRR